MEILKVLYRGASILILDEPTAVLTPQETEKLFAILRRMKEQGCAIVIITHKLNEVLAISDRVEILRKGESIGTVDTKDSDEKKLTELMVGRPVTLEIDRPERKADAVPEIVIRNLNVERPDGTPGLTNVNFELMEGEILGVAGIAGSGQKELCEAITGLTEIKEGSIVHREEELVGMTFKDIRSRGIRISFVPEDRLGMGLVASMGMVDNVLLKHYQDQQGIFIDRKTPRKMAEKMVKELGILTPSVDTPVRMLSGGNVQKVLLGREIIAEPNVLLTAYPVRGLDINSSYTVYDLLNEQKKKGVAVLLVGEDLDVLLSISDRILVLCHGEVSGIVDARKTTKEEVGLLMTGVKGTKEEKEESTDGSK